MKQSSLFCLFYSTLSKMTKEGTHLRQVNLDIGSVPWRGFNHTLYLSLLIRKSIGQILELIAEAVSLRGRLVGNKLFGGNLSQAWQPNKTQNFHPITFFLSRYYLFLSLTPNDPLEFGVHYMAGLIHNIILGEEVITVCHISSKEG